jgi:O-antigen/teichoic acid export membrane protein
LNLAIGTITLLNENRTCLATHPNSIMIIKSLIIIAFILILISLGSALFHLVNRKAGDQSQKTLRDLTFRIGLSMLLFVFLFIAVATGIFEPHGLGEGMQMHKPIQTERIK